MRPVASVVHHGPDELGRGLLPVPDPADPGEEVDDAGRYVQDGRPELGGLVVPGEHVVIILKNAISIS